MWKKGVNYKYILFVIDIYGGHAKMNAKGKWGIKMKRHLRKILAILMMIVTLGLYIPPSILASNTDDHKTFVAPRAPVQKDEQQGVVHKKNAHQATISEASLESIKEAEINISNMIVDQAKASTYSKLGPKITHQVEDQLIEVVFPNLEQTLEKMVQPYECEGSYLGLIDEPSSGYGEKIFTLYDYRADEAIARFDVRRVNRPLEGYWFIFHYHLKEDDFEEHYPLGDIYWDKNTPPKWQS